MCLILGLETSCDETSASVLWNGCEIRSNVIASQIALHQKYGGVVPELASRKHLENINVVIREALDTAGATFDDLDAVAVTHGPGLVGALVVGVATAKAIALAKRIPLIGVNHIEGHIYANFLAHPELEPPMVCLVVSGGHSDLVFMKAHGSYEILGRTRDDAAGEAFDKIARVLGLGYPGGPMIDQLAAQGEPAAYSLPRARLEAGSLDFSFSGLKTAVLNFVNQMRQQGQEFVLADLAASFQQAIVDVLVEKLIQAARAKDIQQVALAGGVASNNGLRAALQQQAAREGIRVVVPPPILCTDNAAMIAAVGTQHYRHKHFSGPDLNCSPTLRLGQTSHMSFKKMWIQSPVSCG